MPVRPFVFGGSGACQSWGSPGHRGPLGRLPDLVGHGLAGPQRVEGVGRWFRWPVGLGGLRVLTSF